MKRILVTGALGYIGCNLVNDLAKNKNYYIIAVDIGYFYRKKFPQKNVKTLVKSFDLLSIKEIKKIDCVIHLAAISNDPSALINSKLSWETNVLGTYKLLNLCKIVKIKKFIFASSGSVYGVKKEKKVHENLELLPLTDYNKTKMIGERVVHSYSNYFSTVVLRPATVCGFSESMRLDLTVNALTYDALKNKMVKIYGGTQSRPNINIKDMIRVYKFFLNNNCKGTFNIGFENYTINKIAKIIIKTLNNKKIKIKRLRSNDVRSYRLDSSKILKLGFKPKYTIKDAIKELLENFNKKKLFLQKNSLRVNFLKSFLLKK
jgi:nucleoside-diphosphate-sugar epimerase